MSETVAATTDPRTLLEQLAVGRERLRAERAAAKPKLEEADRLNREARETRKRVRKAAARYLNRFRKKAADSAAPVRAAREEIARQQDELNDNFARLTADRGRFAAETVEATESLKRSWELLAEQRAQFAAERTERDAELSRLFQLLEARESETAAASEKLRHERHSTEAELATLKAEVEGLDRRATNARLQLQELEQLRAKATADRVTGAAFVSDLVSLAVSGDIHPKQLSALQLREEDIQRERRDLDARRRELEMLAEHLSDGRRVLAAQIEEAANAKDALRTDESATVDELEDLVRAVEFREAMLEARDIAMARHEENRRERERELWKYQTTLDKWNELLAERETRFLAEREQAEVGLAARRGLVADREAGLDAVCQKWEADHARLREELLDALTECREQTAEGRAAVAECERAKRQTQEQAAKLAAWMLAAEQQYAESAEQPGHAKAARRMKVLRKRWDNRFARTLKQLDRQLAKLNAESSAITARHAELQRVAADASERQRQLAVAERRRDRDRVLAEPMPADQPIILSVADAWRRRSDAEIQKLRRTAASASDALLNADAKDDIVPLRAADAA